MLEWQKKSSGQRAEHFTRDIPWEYGVRTVDGETKAFGLSLPSTFRPSLEHFLDPIDQSTLCPAFATSVTIGSPSRCVAP